MKKMNPKFIMVLMLGVLSVLSGCGKKNNNAAVDNGGIGGVASPIGTGGVVSGMSGIGACATLAANTATTLTFYGNLQSGSTGIVSQMPVYGYGSQTGGFGSNYYRNNTAGDSLNVYANGAQAYAVVTLAANTVNAIIQGQSYYSNSSAQVCGLDINASIVAGGSTGPGWTGTIGGGVIKMWSNGQWIRYANSPTYITL